MRARRGGGGAARPEQLQAAGRRASRTTWSAESLRDDVDGVFGHFAIGGELAAVHPHDTRLAHCHLVLARQVGGLGARRRRSVAAFTSGRSPAHTPVMSSAVTRSVIVGSRAWLRAVST